MLFCFLFRAFLVWYSYFENITFLQGCLGKNSCSIGISNLIFGSDPCRGVIKTLAVEARCRSLPNAGFSQFWVINKQLTVRNGEVHLCNYMANKLAGNLFIRTCPYSEVACCTVTPSLSSVLLFMELVWSDSLVLVQTKKKKKKRFSSSCACIDVGIMLIRWFEDV